MQNALKYLDPALFSNKLIALLLVLCAISMAKGASGQFDFSEKSVYVLIRNSDLPLFDEASLLQENRPSPLLQLFRIKKRENRKITAAILAFPFPFGIVGLHRIYLGTAPSVPVVYIATLGGAFGILPLIDCFVLLFDKNLENYVNNKKVFMWVN